MTIPGYLAWAPHASGTACLLAVATQRGNPNSWVQVGLVAGAFIASIVVLFVTRGIAAEKLSRIAQRYGLTLHKPTGLWGLFVGAPFILGHYRGREVGIYSYYSGRGRNRRSWMVVFTSCKGTDNWVVQISRRVTFWTWTLSKRGRVWFATALEAASGGKVMREKREVPDFVAVPTHDEMFDRLYTIKSNLREGVPAKLFQAVRDRLIEDKSIDGRLALNNGQVMFIYPGSIWWQKNADRIAGQLDFVCDVAEKIET